MLLETQLSHIIGTETPLLKNFIKAVHKYLPLNNDADYEPISSKDFRVSPLIEGDAYLFICVNGLAFLMMRTGRYVLIMSEHPDDDPQIIHYYDDDLQYAKHKIRTTCGELKQLFHVHNATVDRNKYVPKNPQEEEEEKRERAKATKRTGNKEQGDPLAAPRVLNRIKPQLNKMLTNMIADMTGLATHLVKSHNFKRAAVISKRLQKLKSLAVALHSDDVTKEKFLPLIEDAIFTAAMSVPAIKKEFDEAGLSLSDLRNEYDIEHLATYNGDEYSFYLPKFQEFTRALSKSGPELAEVLHTVKNILRLGSNED